MRSFDLTKSAQTDLKSIAKHTQDQWGVRQRNAYLKEIDQLFRSLATHPEMGRACAEIREGYRKFPHSEHVIYYQQLVTGDLLIVRILHATMDVDSRIG